MEANYTTKGSSTSLGDRDFEGPGSEKGYSQWLEGHRPEVSRGRFLGLVSQESATSGDLHSLEHNRVKVGGVVTGVGSPYPRAYKKKATQHDNRMSRPNCVSKLDRVNSLGKPSSIRLQRPAACLTTHCEFAI